MQNRGTILLGILFFLASAVSFAQSVEVNVGLTPAGSFKAQTKKMKGQAHKNGDAVTAENILIDLSSLSTGISLRDKHLKERLEVTKYPEAKLLKASGKNGKGVALIEIKGKKQKVNGTYKVNGNMLQAEFKVELPSLDINDVRYMGIGVKDQITIHVNVPIKDGPARSTASKKSE